MELMHSGAKNCGSKSEASVASIDDSLVEDHDMFIWLNLLTICAHGGEIRAGKERAGVQARGRESVMEGGRGDDQTGIHSADTRSRCATPHLEEVERDHEACNEARERARSVVNNVARTCGAAIRTGNVHAGLEHRAAHEPKKQQGHEIQEQGERGRGRAPHAAVAETIVGRGAVRAANALIARRAQHAGVRLGAYFVGADKRGDLGRVAGAERQDAGERQSRLSRCVIQRGAFVRQSAPERECIHRRGRGASAGLLHCQLREIAADAGGDGRAGEEDFGLRQRVPVRSVRARAAQT